MHPYNYALTQLHYRLDLSFTHLLKIDHHGHLFLPTSIYCSAANIHTTFSTSGCRWRYCRNSSRFWASISLRYKRIESKGSSTMGWGNILKKVQFGEADLFASKAEINILGNFSLQRGLSVTCLWVWRCGVKIFSLKNVEFRGWGISGNHLYTHYSFEYFSIVSWQWWNDWKLNLVRIWILLFFTSTWKYNYSRSKYNGWIL